MERIVNGYYADPESTRDIIGITPKEFEILIDVLREKYMVIEKLFEMDPKSLRTIVRGNANVLEQDASETLEQLPDILNNMQDQYAVIYSFLEAINQPYPGASY